MRRSIALSAADMMTTEMITIDSNASILEAAALLVDRGISGAPVRDDFGRIVGLISLRDIARFERERAVVEVGGAAGDWPAAQRSAGREPLPWGYHVEPDEQTRVSDFMTPIVISLPRSASLEVVVRAMLDKKVHRILVHDEDGDIVGLISAVDVLRVVFPQH